MADASGARAIGSRPGTDVPRRHRRRCDPVRRQNGIPLRKTPSLSVKSSGSNLAGRVSASQVSGAKRWACLVVFERSGCSYPLSFEPALSVTMRRR